MLIVDDDEADVLLIEEALETALVPPVTSRVADGRQAVDFLRRRGYYEQARRPDLVLLDLNMPRMNGHEVLAELKGDADLCSIPVVVLTTSSAAEEIQASYAEHASAVVTKPLDLPSFEAVVRTINDFYLDVAALPHRYPLRLA
ncbi:response regulator [Actinoplanes palleronii]|uniref:Two-component system response regulator n=1 Tax=Actinoplanes palleronii TaxID=113570 RepID=A0ABQ4BQ07_9ACTN|nr:response regulator [Actinoplanes palleronii]GIE72741.1 two-component system response regulator [Actinoplanes palleronii]